MFERFDGWASCADHQQRSPEEWIGWEGGTRPFASAVPYPPGPQEAAKRDNKVITITKNMKLCRVCEDISEIYYFT